MSLENCPRCGKVYGQVSGSRNLCPSCIKEEADNYLKVFRFLSSRPSANAHEIAQETGVELLEIYRYVRENRLQLVRTDTGLTCELCGSSISNGKYCEKCQEKLSKELKKDLDKLRKDKFKTDQKYSIERDKVSGKIKRKRIDK